MKGNATVELEDGTIRQAEIHWFEAQGIVARILKSRGSEMNEFVICINNKSNSASLILGKVYRKLPDAEAERHKMIRIVDEDKSEQDGYLYSASMFVPIELPKIAERALAGAI